MRIILPALTFLALCAGSFAVRADDDLDRIRGAAKIAAQKWAQQVDDAITQSRKKEKSDPGAAKEVLQDMMRRVKNSADLTEELRAPLVRRLQLNLNFVEDVIRDKNSGPSSKNYDTEKPRTKPSYDPPSKGAASAFIKDFQSTAKGATDSHQSIIKKREVANLNVLNTTEKHVPIPDESGIAFPKKEVWERISQRAKPQLTKKEVALLKTLNSVMSVNYDGDKFRAVIDHIQDKTGLTIIMDEASMQDAKVEYDDPVTFKQGKVSVRTILKKVLGDKGLTYVIKEATIHVMTPKKASEMTVVRSYPVGDLVMPANQAQMMQMYGPFFANAMKAQNAQQLINLIQSTLEPSYWQANGGPGTIIYLPLNDSLVVRASAEMHYQLGSPGLFGR